MSVHSDILGRKYMNALTCKLYTFSRQNLETFHILHGFLPSTVAKVSTLKNRLFWPTLYLHKCYAAVILQCVCLWWRQ